MIYLDYAATTPLLKEVERAMVPFGRKSFANPRAIHGAGRKAKEAVEVAREKVAQSLKIKKEAIIFNSGGTEGNNQALAGIAEQYFLEKGKWPHLIISSLEHASVLQTAEAIASRGGSFSLLPATREGVVDVEALQKLLTPETVIISTLLVQNELGTIQPVKKIRDVLDAYKKKLKRDEDDFPYLHVDATQAPRVLSLASLLGTADSYILDGSKIYGPKGTGVLIKRPSVRIAPVIWGGGQEGGLRSGTENVAGLVGFATALAVITKEREKQFKKLILLRKVFLEELRKKEKNFHINGEGVPSIVNISFPGVVGERLLHRLSEKEIYISTTSACASVYSSASRILLAIGKTEKEAQESIRISFGRETTMSEVKKTVLFLAKTVQELRPR